MYKVILKFKNNDVKEIESIKIETLKEAEETAIKGKELYGATDYEIKLIDK